MLLGWVQTSLINLLMRGRVFVVLISKLVGGYALVARRFSMLDSHFPEEVPNIDDSVRVTPVLVDYVVRNYKFFCEESHVTSRFFATDYADRQCVEISLTGERIRNVRFNLKTSTWSIQFDNQTIQVEVEKILG